MQHYLFILNCVAQSTLEPICRTNEHEEYHQAPRVSTHREKKMNEFVKEDYLNLMNSAESASLLAPLEYVDRLDGAKESEISKEW